MNCKKCNKEINEKSSFCQYCGGKVEYDIDKGFEEFKKTHDELMEIVLAQHLFFLKHPKFHKEKIKFVEEKLKEIKELKQKNPKKYGELMHSFIEED